MYRLPLADAGFDLAVLQMVLHYAEDPAGALAEAARVLRPGGRLIVVDLAAHARTDVMTRLAHRWPGFDDARLRELFDRAGLAAEPALAVPGPLQVRLWQATRLPPAHADPAFPDQVPETAP
jgi:ArsR family transcriptional regulator